MNHVRSVLAALMLFLVIPATAQASTDWPTYHRDNLRDGYSPGGYAFNGPLLQEWTSQSLRDTIYAEPLLVGNTLIVADISDTVTALNAGTGSLLWQTKVGNPVPLTYPPFPTNCGNVDPIGIIGTPVVDPVAGIVYALAMEQPATYYLVGLDLQTGRARFPQVKVSPPGFNIFVQQQRPALTLANGYVYASFGGYIGDCGNYHAWVVGTPAGGSGSQVFFVNNPYSGSHEAGFWATSGAAVDSSGNLYITSGNGAACGGGAQFDNGNTVFKLSPTLGGPNGVGGVVDWWAPSVWNELNCADDDLGSAGPSLVGTSNNLVFQVGKSGWGYLLPTTLSQNGHFGNELHSGQVCSAATTDTSASDQVFGGVAYADPYIYVPCPEGIVALRLTAGPSFSIAWTSAAISPGPPIVQGGVVWAVDTSNGSLYGLNATTGATLFSATNLGGSTHFTTPAFGEGRVYAPIGDQVMAFGQPRPGLLLPLPHYASGPRGVAPPPVPQGSPGLHPITAASQKSSVSRASTPSLSLSPATWRAIEALVRRFLDDVVTAA